MTEPTTCCSVGSQANFAEEDGIVDGELATPRLPSYKGFYYLRINTPYYYMWVYVHVCIRTCVYTYMCVYVHVCICTCVYTYMCVYLHVCIRSCVYMYMCVYVHVCVRTCVYRMYIYIRMYMAVLFSLWWSKNFRKGLTIDKL